MITAKTMQRGDTVRDKQLGLLWVAIANEGDGAVQIERNGVRVSASTRDLELVTDRPSRQYCR
jgi:hypothetical protein